MLPEAACSHSLRARAYTRGGWGVVGCGVWGLGFWVLGLGIRVLGFMYYVAPKLKTLNPKPLTFKACQAIQGSGAPKDLAPRPPGVEGFDVGFGAPQQGGDGLVTQRIHVPI